MKRFILTIALLSSALVAGARTSIEEVLRSVETNNKELQANRQMVTAQKLEAKLDNNLPDPTVTYSHLYGNKEGMGFTGELVASQSFDFPSLYMQRNKLSKQKGENYDRQGEEVRQQILLQAKEACLDLIFLNQQVVELPLSFADLRQEILENDRRLLSLQSAKAVSSRQISVNKTMGLPSFELGYRMNPSSGGERFNGFLVGISIPLFSNRNNVKQAKAQNLYTDLQLESTMTAVENELLQLYNQSVALKTSIDEYGEVLESQNNLALLNKAIQAGQISMIEYFVDVTTLYQSMQNHMQLQNEYQKVMAQLYKFKL
jgi:hypothetical protein